MKRKKIIMKCGACGYESHSGYTGQDHNGNWNIPPNERFETHVIVSNKIKLEIDKNSNLMMEKEGLMCLYCCPNCSTVQMGKYNKKDWI